MLYPVRYYREVNDEMWFSRPRAVLLTRLIVYISPEWRKSVSGIKNLCNA
jgi:hypothetical protein